MNSRMVSHLPSRKQGIQEVLFIFWGKVQGQGSKFKAQGLKFKV